MRIAIMGAGLIGGYLGGRLAAHGHDVFFVARPRQRELFAREGLAVSDYAGFSARLAPAQLALGDVSGLGDAAYVLVTVKSAQTAQAAAELAPHLRESCTVVSFQNGVDAAAQLERVLGRKVLRGMVPFNVVAQRPAQLLQATSGTLVVERTDRAEPLISALREAGLEARADDDIANVQWGKLLLNLNNAVNALSGLPLKAQLGQRGYRQVLAACLAEGLRVTHAAGLWPRIDAPLPVRFVPTILRLPTPLFRLLAASMLRIDPAARSSMLEDLSAGRSTEVDALNGAVVRLAEAHGQSAPRNAAMVRAITECHGRGSPALSAEALLARLHGA